MKVKTAGWQDALTPWGRGGLVAMRDIRAAAAANVARARKRCLAAIRRYGDLSTQYEAATGAYRDALWYQKKIEALVLDRENELRRDAAFAEWR